MIGNLLKINIAPGINKEAGSYGSEGTYNDGDKVRFYNGLPEKVKGWTAFTAATFTGICRALKGWLALDNVKYLALGTHTKLFVYRNDALFDITPADLGTGHQHNTEGLGYGAGTYGHSGGWGSAASAGSGITLPVRTWSFAFFGDHLIANPRGEKLYRWRPREEGTGVLATALPGAPLFSEFIMVNEQTRHLVSFGTEDPFRSGIQDKLLLRWSDQEDSTNWEISPLTSAGSYRVTVGNKLISALPTAGQTLFWTDQALYSMVYIGGAGGSIEDQLVFDFNLLGTACGIISPNAAVNVNNTTFWMGLDSFFAYDGRVQKIPCTVQHFVFENINVAQLDKVYAGINQEYNEIWWFYPVSTGTSEISRYVAYNYVENHWHIGSLVRTSWLDKDLFTNPLATDASGAIFSHETGTSDNGSAVTAYLQSSEFDISGEEGDGQSIAFMDRLIPEVTAYNGGAQAGTLTLTVKSRNYPTQTQTSKGPFSITSSTTKLDFRARGRQLQLYYESTGSTDNWRLVSQRVRLKDDNRR